MALAANVLLAALLAASVTIAAGSSLTLNLSPSLPTGLYLLEPGTTPRRGDLVTLAVPATASDLVDRRRYLPAGYGLLKILVASAGDRVCFRGRRFVVRGEVIATIQDHDSDRRPLVPSSFCGRLPDGMAVVATFAERSFDSRYFGPVPVSTLTPASPLWTF